MNETQAQPVDCNSTLAFFDAAKAQDLRSQAGRLTLAQAVGLTDAMTGVYVCCMRAFGQLEVPMHLHAQLERLRQSSDLSIAQVRHILALWHRWTWQYKLDEVPTLQSVQGFLYALKD